MVEKRPTTEEIEEYVGFVISRLKKFRAANAQRLTHFCYQVISFEIIRDYEMWLELSRDQCESMDYAIRNNESIKLHYNEDMIDRSIIWANSLCPGLFSDLDDGFPPQLVLQEA